MNINLYKSFLEFRYMFWQKKETKRGLPEIPPLVPQISRISSKPNAGEDSEEEDENDLSVEKHNLPSFPDSPTQKGFSQAAIKDAIDSPEEESESNEDSKSKTFKAVEMEDWKDTTPKIMEKADFLPPVRENKVTKESEEIDESEEKDELPHFSSIPAAPTMSAPEDKPLPFSKPSKSKEIYVKIDKFYSAKKALDTTKAKLQEIDELLKKIRETRLREEQELTSWEKEMAAVKSRIKEITDNIFERVE